MSAPPIANAPPGQRLREFAPPPYRLQASAPARSGGQTEEKLQEHELVALWLLGRAPPQALPWPLLRPGRAGRGPGPDVREAAFLLPEGVVRSGPLEVHLTASDFVRHGHDRDPAYGALILHLVWIDDRPQPGGPLPLPGGGFAPTCAVGPALGGDPERLRALLRLGPSGAEPCVALAAGRGAEETTARLRAEGRRRMAELAWRADALAAGHGWHGAWLRLLLHALEASAGRRRETPEARLDLAAAIGRGLGGEPLRRLAALAAGRGGTGLERGAAAAGGAGRGLRGPRAGAPQRGADRGLAGPAPLRPHAGLAPPARRARAAGRRAARPGAAARAGPVVPARRLRRLPALRGSGRRRRGLRRSPPPHGRLTAASIRAQHELLDHPVHDLGAAEQLALGEALRLVGQPARRREVAGDDGEADLRALRLILRAHLGGAEVEPPAQPRGQRAHDGALLLEAAHARQVERQQHADRDHGPAPLRLPHLRSWVWLGPHPSPLRQPGRGDSAARQPSVFAAC